MCAPPNHVLDHTLYKGQGWVASGKWENKGLYLTQTRKTQDRKNRKQTEELCVTFLTFKRLKDSHKNPLSPPPSSLPLLFLLCLTQHSQPSMSVTNSSAYRSERSFHQTSSSSSGNPYMEKSRGLFAEDFGSFMRPGSDALGFSSKLEAGSGLCYSFCIQKWYENNSNSRLKRQV